jgi:DNA (cytosine-5)-methyltransferase 1
MLKVLDLFSGIGGFSLGLESTRHFSTTQFVEQDAWCQKILAKNFPGVPIHDDIKTYKGRKADVVCGGFPCQPFSVAGKQKATDDDRHLWPEMFRVIKEAQPEWVIGENVRNFISISEGMVFEQTCLDLESEGYEVQTFSIPAAGVNAPHQRYRVWIIGHKSSNVSNSHSIEWNANKYASGIHLGEQSGIHLHEKRNRNEVWSEAERCGEVSGNEEHLVNSNSIRCEHNQETKEEEFRRSETSTQSGSSDVANSNDRRLYNGEPRTLAETQRQESEGRNKSTQTFKDSSEDVSNSSVERLQRHHNSEAIEEGETNRRSSRADVANTDSQRGCLWETDRQDAEDVGQSPRCKVTGQWDFEPNVGRVANGIPNRVDRLKGLGNAIVPQIAYQIGISILSTYNKEA